MFSFSLFKIDILASSNSSDVKIVSLKIKVQLHKKTHKCLLRTKILILKNTNTEDKCVHETREFIIIRHISKASAPS